jgi:hypothetical protein
VRSLAVALRIASGQLGVVTRRQLIAEDVSDDEIKHLTKAGAIERVHAGVYVTAGSARTHEQQALAACRSCGDGAAASFVTAAAIHEIRPVADEMHVTIPHAIRRRSTTIRIHRSSVLGPMDVMRRGRLLVTTPARTLTDLASCTPRSELALLTDEVLRRRLIPASALLRYTERSSIRVFPRIATLRSIVKDRLAFGLPESGFEGLMIQLVDDYGLPRPMRQYGTLATGRRVRFDLAYPDHGFVIELDGWDPHSMREQWQSDHDRNNALELAGWGRLGFTWDDVNHRRAYVAITVGERLGLHPTRWGRPRSSQVGRARPGCG